MTGSRKIRKSVVNSTKPRLTPKAVQKKKPLCRLSGVRKNGKNLTIVELIPIAENWAYITAMLTRILASPTCSSLRKFGNSRILLTYPTTIPK